MLHASAVRAPDSPARQVQITQRGQMWLKPGARAKSFTAVQHLTVDRIAFSWKARFPLVGPLALSVVDGYDSGGGALTVSLFGLPLQRQRGLETTRGAALRYLAELPFVPPALLGNRELEFREIDDRHVEAGATVAGERLTVILELDESGNIVRSSSTMRKLKRDGGWRSAPWGGRRVPRVSARSTCRPLARPTGSSTADATSTGAAASREPTHRRGIPAVTETEGSGEVRVVFQVYSASASAIRSPTFRLLEVPEQRTFLRRRLTSLELPTMATVRR